MAGLTSDLLTAVRRSGYLPDAHDLTDADFLAWGDEEIGETFAALLRSAREEHRVTYEDITLAVGTTRYRLPRRALLRTVRGVTYLDASGNESPAEELPAMEAWRVSTSTAQSLYRFEGDEIVLTSAPPTSGTKLRVRYTQRFPRLATVAQCAIIDRPLTTRTLELGGTVPATVSATDSLVDIVRGDSPYPWLYTDLLVDGIDADTLTIDASTPIIVADVSDSRTNGARADYICPRDSSCYVPLPQEMHGALALGIVARALDALGDPRAAGASGRFSMAVDKLRAANEPRNQDRKPRIIDHGGRLRGGGRRPMWGR